MDVLLCGVVNLTAGADSDFEANAKDGIGVDWPVRYNEIAPWYDYAEKFAGISGSKEGLAAIT